MVRIKVSGSKIFDEIQTEILAMSKDLRLQADKIGLDASAKMKEFINSDKVRPQAGEPTRLEDNIEVEYFPEGGWGVGEIARLNDKAKHWRVINNGSDHMVGKRLPIGEFNPGESKPSSANFREGRWQKTGGNEGFSPIVTKPIPPTNYIERTINFVRQAFRQIKIRK